MGIFSLFGKKKGGHRESSKPGAAKPAADNGISNSGSSQRNREIGQSTAMKIDAIESAMTQDMFREAQSRKRALTSGPPTVQPAPPTTLPPAFDADELPELTETLEHAAAGDFSITLPIPEENTDFFASADISEGVVAEAVEIAPEVQEAAVLFANGQVDPVEMVLRHAIALDKNPTAPRMPWWMLFDLYQITNQNFAFDSLSIDYASQFETSPPAWSGALQQEPPGKKQAHSGVTPTIAFAGKLDDSIAKQLERIQKLAAKNKVFRLEFARVTEVHPEGCKLLLAGLKNLQKSDRDLILVGASEFAEKIRASIKLGRREDTETPWLLLLEILQLLNREKEFEEVSMEYCVTFEVSPPSFETSKTSKVSTAPVEVEPEEGITDRFMMPPVVEGEIDALLKSLADYAAERHTVLIDCSRLGRVDFTAAGLLMNTLAPLTAEGKTVEFHEVNHLVTALFQVMGLNQIAQIASHKY